MNAVLWLAMAAAALGAIGFAVFGRRATRTSGEEAMSNAVAAFFVGGACVIAAAILLVVGLLLKLF